MQNTIMKFRYDGQVYFGEKKLPYDIDTDVYVGLFEQMFEKINSDFLILEEDDDPINVQLSLAMDLHHFIDVYQLARNSLNEYLKAESIKCDAIEGTLSYNEHGELTVDFITSVSAVEVLVAIVILAGEILDSEDVNTLMMNIIEDIYSSEEVVN